MYTIKEVTTKKEMKKFVKFPNKLYKDCQYFIPDIYESEKDFFNPKKNPSYDYSESKQWLCYDEKGEVVGRVAAILSHAYNQKTGGKFMRYSHIDMIDDVEITRLLMNEVAKYAKEKGMDTLMGPLGFTDMDKQGLLVEGYDEMSNFITLYHYPYYKEHFEKLGFVKDQDWVEYQIKVPDEIPPLLDRMSERVLTRYHLKIKKFKSKKEVGPYINEAFRVVNEAFAPLYGTVPLSQKQIDEIAASYVPLLNLDFVYVVVDGEDKVIAIGLMIPSLNKGLRRSKGKLFPFGFMHVLRDLKTVEVLDLLFIAVEPKYQSTGVAALMIREAIVEAIKYGAKYAETGPELETNIKVQSQWKHFETRQHRRRRTYKIKVDEFLK